MQRVYKTSIPQHLPIKIKKNCKENEVDATKPVKYKQPNMKTTGLKTICMAAMAVLFLTAGANAQQKMAKMDKDTSKMSKMSKMNHKKSEKKMGKMSKMKKDTSKM